MRKTEFFEWSDEQASISVSTSPIPARRAHSRHRGPGLASADLVRTATAGFPGFRAKTERVETIGEAERREPFQANPSSHASAAVAVAQHLAEGRTGKSQPD